MSTTNTAKPAKKPVYRKQLPGGISAAVFENTRDGRTYRSVNLQRSYKQNGKWERRNLFLDHEHIPFIQEVLDGVWKYLNETPISSQSADHVEQIDEAEPADESTVFAEADTPFDA